MEVSDPEAWAQVQEQGVRPYALTGGRTRPRHAMRLLSHLIAQPAAKAGRFGPEAERALSMCRGQARSVAEIAAVLRQPVQVTKILLSDLIDSGVLVLALPDALPQPDNVQLLEALLAGLRTKFPEAA